MPMQIRRTPTPNAPPSGLLEGQLAVEMASTPPALWVGVPTAIDPSGRRLLNAAPAPQWGYAGANTSWSAQPNDDGVRFTTISANTSIVLPENLNRFGKTFRILITAWTGGIITVGVTGGLYVMGPAGWVQSTTSNIQLSLQTAAPNGTELMFVSANDRVWYMINEGPPLAGNFASTAVQIPGLTLGGQATSIDDGTFP